MSDPETMSYNAGYEVAYDGYHYDTGCIDFPKSKWSEWIKKLDDNFYFAYIEDVDSGKFVGYVNFKVQQDKSATMGIVIKAEYRGQGYMRPAVIGLIEEARRHKAISLIDSVPENRSHAHMAFRDLGFEITDTYEIDKFHKKEKILLIKKDLQK